jgi:hypothetical protein
MLGISKYGSRLFFRVGCRVVNSNIDTVFRKACNPASTNEATAYYRDLGVFNSHEDSVSY